MNLINVFNIAFQQKKEKGWDFIYIAVDIHGTIFRPCYDGPENFEFYPWAKNTLKLLSNRPDIKLILWSSSHKDMLKKYVLKLENNEIKIDYVNENPEISDTKLASFKEKFYFNIGIDNNFGFDPEVDWKTIFGYFSA